MLFATVWHYWIAPLIFLGALGFGIATIVGYLAKVVKPKYPPRGRD